MTERPMRAYRITYECVLPDGFVTQFMACLDRLVIASGGEPDPRPVVRGVGGEPVNQESTLKRMEG